MMYGLWQRHLASFAALFVATATGDRDTGGKVVGRVVDWAGSVDAVLPQRSLEVPAGELLTPRRNVSTGISVLQTSTIYRTGVATPAPTAVTVAELHANVSTAVAAPTTPVAEPAPQVVSKLHQVPGASGTTGGARSRLRLHRHQRVATPAPTVVTLTESHANVSTAVAAPTTPVAEPAPQAASKLHQLPGASGTAGHQRATKELEPPQPKVLPASLLEGRRNAVAAAASASSPVVLYLASMLPTLDWVHNAIYGASSLAAPAVIQARKRRVAEGLILELHLPSVSLQVLHGYEGGSVASFLVDLREAIGTTAGLPKTDISILGIHERYTLHPSSREPSFASMPSSHKEGIIKHRETLVRFAILADAQAAISPQKALKSLELAVGYQGSALMQGKIGHLLKNCSIALELTESLALAPSQGTRGVQFAALAMPIGISAALTGILIWLAAT